ncbi:glycosyl transferase family 2 [Acidilobus saccharovorans 345-15]|uniref:Glycosyl transferase family 2 n=1 Tax=Acidilobus saccharovorans (strain DSM 16705 / JCM 18335 / VKM B-2471 / 345-15) TaxID=666510 RepID=D9Q198_ACIS3|nr:glycosyltransferase family 2 protein [Acidilobus saccharovorans]ADL19086.1 glycosyl transferase family 2 [Acidilobus saccharovorans 345-15]
MSSKGLISVIVTAYNRKQYLPHALRSLEAQTLPRDRFEVIVVKNFEDPVSDSIIRRNGWKEVYSDEQYQGRFLLAGLEEAKGDIITFLDDDDMYREDRLEKVYTTFKSVTDVVYFYNSQKPIDEQGNILYTQLKSSATERLYLVKSRALLKVNQRLGLCLFEEPSLIRVIGLHDFNSSSMAIGKAVLEDYKENLRSLKLALDFFIGSVARNSEGLLAIYMGQLTYYRLHQKNTSSFSNAWKERSKRLEALYREALYQIFYINGNQLIGNLYPKSCRCNRYRLFAVGSKLHLYAIPLKELRYVYNEFPTSLKELYGYLRCAIKLKQLHDENKARAAMSSIILTFGSLLLWIGGYMPITPLRRSLYDLAGGVTRKIYYAI